MSRVSSQIEQCVQLDREVSAAYFDGHPIMFEVEDGISRGFQLPLDDEARRLSDVHKTDPIEIDGPQVVRSIVARKWKNVAMGYHDWQLAGTVLLTEDTQNNSLVFRRIALEASSLTRIGRQVIGKREFSPIKYKPIQERQTVRTYRPDTNAYTNHGIGIVDEVVSGVRKVIRTF